MGYYTTHELTVYKKNPDTDKWDRLTDGEINKFQEEIAENSVEYDETWDLFDDAIKWYHHDKDLLNISKKYPDLLFQLDGIGEEELDIWREYYYKGKYQPVEVKIVYEGFDEDKLVDPNDPSAILE